jgi:hypothetical protein
VVPVDRAGTRTVNVPHDMFATCGLRLAAYALRLDMIPPLEEPKDVRPVPVQSAREREGKLDGILRVLVLVLLWLFCTEYGLWCSASYSRTRLGHEGWVRDTLWTTSALA